MQLHEIKPIHKKKRRKRVGRGGKRGTYSGRGIKGQKSRAGRKLVPEIRHLIKRYPKLRGYRFKSIHLKPVVVNLGFLEKEFKAGDIVSPEILLKQGLIRRIKGKVPTVKILAGGNLVKKIEVEGCKVSKAAKENIEKAGGTVQ
ncbi:MAG: uL15 family ribosomal protein [Candidatus Pacearchaeota archaeon]|nr:uL15 family ribosomal protein [Candidatus Nealsonbacteria bacterium]MDZ4226682.1 uL15 family ribosomal protein [Candidatus Pacearchaeota archaeon]